MRAHPAIFCVALAIALWMVSSAAWAVVPDPWSIIGSAICGAAIGWFCMSLYLRIRS